MHEQRIRKGEAVINSLFFKQRERERERERDTFCNINEQSSRPGNARKKCIFSTASMGPLIQEVFPL